MGFKRLYDFFPSRLQCRLVGHIETGILSVVIVQVLKAFSTGSSTISVLTIDALHVKYIPIKSNNVLEVLYHVI